MDSRTWKPFILVSLFAVSSMSFARGQQAGEIPPSARITVLVYNYAHVPENTLGRAKQTALGIFRQAGVEIIWLDLPAVLATDLKEASTQPFVSKEDLILRIVPRFEPGPPRPRKERLGLPSANMAMISFQALQDEAASGDATPEEILGAAIAHELGHVLLGSDSHSAKGIMRPHWKREDFERGPQGGLAFTPAQAQLIRTEAERRFQEQTAEERLSMTTR